jgi:hypothetical protein
MVIFPPDPLPAAAHRCNAWQWLVVVSSAQQKLQQNHLQLTNGSTILKTFTFPKNLDLFKLIYSIFWINFSKNILAMSIPKMLPTVELRGGGALTVSCVLCQVTWFLLASISIRKLPAKPI